MIAAKKSKVWYGYGAVFVAVIAIVFTIVASFGDHSHVFTAVGLWALAIVLLPPALLPRYDLFSPWSFVVLSVVVGLTIRGFYIGLNYPIYVLRFGSLD